MTSTDVEKLIRNALTTASLWQVVDEYRSQFLEFPDGFFAEIVLNDGSRIADVESIMRDVEGSLRKQGTELHPIVRANWAVQNVGDPHPARAASGGIRRALAVPVTLASGDARREVEVDVGLLAVDEIKRRIEGKGLDESGAVREMVREFVEMQLSLGGESYWDPILNPRRELSEGALLYLFGHTSAAQNLGIQR